jgi:hypothetical protein
MANTINDKFIEELTVLVGENNILSPNENPNKYNVYCINVNAFKNAFNDTYLINYADEIWIDKLKRPKKFITIDEIIEFIKKANNNNKKGVFHIYMDLSHSYFGVIIKDNIWPLYNKLDSINRKFSEPIRDEYLIIWMINRKIKNHIFFKNYYYNWLTPSYQITIQDRDYDLTFNFVDIIVEIQEDDGNHKDNDNDIYKR